MPDRYDPLDPSIEPDEDGAVRKKKDTPDDHEQRAFDPEDDKKAEKDEPLTDDDTITIRIKVGRAFMQPHVARSLRNGNKYLDSSNQFSTPTSWGGEGKPISQPVGEVNALAINIRNKVSGFTTAYPDYLVEVGNAPDEIKSEAGPLVRDWLLKWYRHRDHSRVFRKAALSRFVAGIGSVAYLWDREQGPVYEYVAPEDFLVDPHTKDDGWNNLRWGARRIRLPVKVAEEIYGTDELSYGSTDFIGAPILAPVPQFQDDKESATVEIWMYYDEDTEAHVNGDRVLKKERNLYKRVPIRCYCGNINPVGQFPLSDYDTSLGVFEMYRRLINMMNSTAKNGGGVAWVRTEFVDENQLEQLANGDLNALLTIKGQSGENVLGFTANQTLSPAILEAINLMKSSLDADTGVTAADRGEAPEPGQSPTQAAIQASSSGSNASLERRTFELFVEALINDCVWMQREFGVDEDETDRTAILESNLLHLALQTVQYVRIVENSTAYADPYTRQQQAGQLFNLGLSAFQLMNQLGSAPNLVELWKDVLRAHDLRNVDRYILNSGGIQGAQQQLAQEGQDPNAPQAQQGAVPPAGLVQGQ